LSRSTNTLTVEEVIKAKWPILQSTMPRQITSDIPWCKPPPGFVKLSIDGSYHDGDKMAGSGVALHDDLASYIYFLPIPEPLQRAFGS
jgi:hypothetical protein